MRIIVSIVAFNSHNKIKRSRLNFDQIEKEMKAIAETGLQEILILTGESRKHSDVKYIGEPVGWPASTLV